MRLRFAILVVLASCFSLGSIGVALVACGGAAFTAAPAEDGGVVIVDSGGTSAEAQAGPFCTPDSGLDLCSDFDQKPLPEAWSNDNTSGGGTGVEDDAASTSPPNSFLATTPALATDGGTARAILTALSLPKGQTHIALDLRIDELDFPNGSDPVASVIALAYAQGAGYIVALEFHPVLGNTSPFAAALLESSLSPGSTVPTLKVTELPNVLTAVGVWYHVTVDFTIDLATNPIAVPASLAITPSGGTTNTKLVTLSPPLGTVGGARSLSIGDQATAAVGEAKLRFDNVTYRH